MRIRTTIAFLIPFLAILPQPALSAEPPEGTLILHVAEGTAPGSVIGDLPALIESDEQITFRIVPPSSPGLQVNSAGQLVVALDAQLDHEGNPTHALTLEVKTRAAADPLKERFVEILSESTNAAQFAGRARWGRRIVRVDVVVDDQPEPPEILPQIFESERAGARAPGLILGRVIAVDPDQGDQLRFRLLDSTSLLSIDPVSGQLSIRDSARVPDVSQVRATIEVVDSTGLAASREIVISIRVSPEQPVKSPRYSPSVATDIHDSSKAPGNVATAKPATSASPPSSHPTQTVTDLADVSGLAVPVNSGSAEEVKPEDNPTNRVSYASAAPPVAARADRAQREQASVFRSAMWLLIGTVCVLGIAVLCWSRLQDQSQSLVLHPETAGPVTDNNRPVDQQSKPPASASSVAQNTGALETPARRTGTTDTRELHSLLESLDETYRPRAAAESVDGSSNDDDENFVIFEDGPSRTSSATAIAKAVKVARETATIPAADNARQTAPTVFTPQGKSERAQMEEFRQIARTYNRADIDRSRRAQMRVEWMSRGAAVASSVITGSICLFTNCFGASSVPCGTVLLAVAAALLMKRSLYYDSIKPSARGTMPPEVTSASPPGATSNR